MHVAAVAGLADAPLDDEPRRREADARVAAVAGLADAPLDDEPRRREADARALSPRTARSAANTATVPALGRARRTTL
ncbi:hypothetical protein [Nannocystis pusilla]|uniref:hypothetical protein n=1 Tax=Nannocystis pusilla TaxID=889268 RepID=UPI003B7F9205